MCMGVCASCRCLCCAVLCTVLCCSVLSLMISHHRPCLFRCCAVCTVHAVRAEPLDLPACLKAVLWLVLWSHSTMAAALPGPATTGTSSAWACHYRYKLSLGLLHGLHTPTWWSHMSHMVLAVAHSIWHHHMAHCSMHGGCMAANNHCSLL